MILCLNANAAIDKTVIIEDFRINAMHRPTQSISLPGGKGCNVARVLKTLEEPALVTGWIGGHAGSFIEARLQEEGLPAAFVRIEIESRTCLSILDPLRGTVTEIYEKGEPLPVDALDKMRNLFKSLLQDCRLLIISGSAPAGVPANFYADLIHLASAAGVPTFLDSSGEALQVGLEQGRPELIKPNRGEFEALLGCETKTLGQVSAAARRVAEQYGVTVAVSLGPEGVVLGSRDGVWHARPPAMAVSSAVGSGDALLAGLAYGRVHGLDLEGTLRLAVACGAANTLRIGAGRVHREDIDRLSPQVEINRLIE